LTWAEKAQKHEAFLLCKRWTKDGRDRIYVSEVLGCGGTLELGNYDLVRGQWNRNGTIKDFSQERQAAMKTKILRIVDELGVGR